MRREVDPSRAYPALDEMVLVGHSMGGLIAKLQTVESSDAFWRTMSDHAFAELKADPETVQALATTFYFRPNPSIRRVVTLGTPHRGSPFANNITRWAGNKLISLPENDDGKAYGTVGSKRTFLPRGCSDRHYDKYRFTRTGFARAVDVANSHAGSLG